MTETTGRLSFTLGIGLEYTKASKQKNPYFKGNTGLALGFTIKSATSFKASIGPFSAIIDVDVLVDNYDSDLLFKFGLEDNLNYYLSPNKMLACNGFVVVSSLKQLVNEVDASISGQASGNVIAEFVGLPQGSSANAKVQFSVSDINNLIQQKPGAFAVFYEVNLELSIPSFIDILLVSLYGKESWPYYSPTLSTC